MSNEWIPGIPQQALVMACAMPLIFLAAPYVERVMNFFIEIASLLLQILWRIVTVAWKRSAPEHRHEGVNPSDGP